MSVFHRETAERSVFLALRSAVRSFPDHLELFPALWTAIGVVARGFRALLDLGQPRWFLSRPVRLPGFPVSGVPGLSTRRPCAQPRTQTPGDRPPACHPECPVGGAAGNCVPRTGLASGPTCIPSHAAPFWSWGLESGCRDTELLMLILRLGLAGCSGTCEPPALASQGAGTAAGPILE